MAQQSIDTPVGPLTVTSDGTGITVLDWVSVEPDPDPVTEAAIAQLAEYFAGAREAFDLPLSPRGNDFQQRFYAALSAIPFGHTRTYGELAEGLGVSAQAIGQACGANPIPVIIPCHRVLGANSLGGFSGAGGVEAKVELLKHEGAAGLLI